jgi:hypothetical protein
MMELHQESVLWSDRFSGLDLATGFAREFIEFRQVTMARKGGQGSLDASIVRLPT